MTRKSIDSELEALQQWLNNKVRLYVENDGASRDEIVQAVIADYWKYREQNVELNDGGTEEGEAQQSLSHSARSLAHTILKRRIADHYRAKVARTANQVNVENSLDEQFASSDPTQYRVLLNEVILLETIQWMTRQSDNDRLLMLRDVDKNGVTGALTPTERKRLSRLRQQLSDWIEKKFKEPLKALLND